MNSNTMTVSVLFFARLRESLGTGELQLTVPSATTVDGLLTILTEKGGPWSQLKGGAPVMIAVNQTMTTTSTLLQDQDEVALFPPVTGG
ncbi:molybdopterin converting factor subunit 1 [Marinobacter caseinilyticus]|uniref:molybdopterin converting factor subunit 1 n=1 Tax=Marinobacter caseinilyticus TaxID=2692195 RepID=UPI001408A622|nr:molybdopterin converting factor subunit 1 [Marinobacter caseinilyticus]